MLAYTKSRQFSSRERALLFLSLVFSAIMSRDRGPPGLHARPSRPQRGLLHLPRAALRQRIREIRRSRALTSHGGRLRSPIEQRFKVAPVVYPPENENVRAFDAIDNDVLPHGTLRDPAPRSSSRARPTYGKLARKEKRPVIESINRVATSMLALSLAT